MADTFDLADDDKARGDSVRCHAPTSSRGDGSPTSSCALDCDAAQGYFFARPREAEANEPLLGRRFVG